MAWDDDVISPNPIKAVAGKLLLDTFKVDVENWLELDTRAPSCQQLVSLVVSAVRELA